MHQRDCTSQCRPHRGRVCWRLAVRWCDDGGFGIWFRWCDAAVEANSRVAIYDTRGRIVKEAAADA